MAALVTLLEILHVLLTESTMAALVTLLGIRDGRLIDWRQFTYTIQTCIVYKKFLHTLTTSTIRF